MIAEAPISRAVLFFPFALLTTAYVPKEALSGWLATVADWNSVTYVLAGLRALVSGGWEVGGGTGRGSVPGTWPRPGRIGPGRGRAFLSGRASRRSRGA